MYWIFIGLLLYLIMKFNKKNIFVKELEYKLAFSDHPDKKEVTLIIFHYFCQIYILPIALLS